ncbi:MAG: ABC transporter ATP-binding protein, partial [Patulibacter sp.]|nr:ABC transporter ATP-binding protein [Patulibacter sp.]
MTTPPPGADGTDRPSAPPAVLTARDVHRRIGDLEILAGVDLEIARREVVAIVGPSGSGKSTLLELVCGLQVPDHGTLITPPAALMPQRDLLLPWLNARDNVALPLRIAGVAKDEARQRADALLRRVSLDAFGSHRPDQLSGGMRQRVSFLRALATDRPLLCLDEPFGALDAITREELQRWLGDLLDDRPRSVLMVTHDVEEAVLLSDRVVVFSPRPARVTATVVVDAPRPARPDPDRVELRTDGEHQVLRSDRGPDRTANRVELRTDAVHDAPTAR